MQLQSSFHTLLVVAASVVAIAAPVTHGNADIIPGKYIVQLKPGIDPSVISGHHATAQAIHQRNTEKWSRRDDGGIEKTYHIKDFNAYAGDFDEETVAEIAKLPEVLSVQPDTVVYLPKLLLSVEEKRYIVTQTTAPWGLGHLSHRLPGSTEYIYDSTAGEGTYIYVIDSGLRPSHAEFEGRATFGYNAVPGSPDDTEEEVHGTGVASIAVGKTFGVAKKAEVIGVKVFGAGTSSASIVLDGFDWAVNDIISKNRVNTSVINMSLGGSYNTAWDSPLQNAYELGIFSVVAAGNENVNASGQSPAGSPYVFTVGNIQKDNARYSPTEYYGSNWGPAVDIFAPGTNIPLATPYNDTSVSTSTGTSQASPQVAGLVCYLRALEGLTTIEEVTDRIEELATKDVVTNPKGSANLVAYNGSGK